jgi:integrase
LALTVKRISRLVSAGAKGRHLDDSGLYLVVTGVGTAHWERRYQIPGAKPKPGATWRAERNIGLGSYKTFTLVEARERNRRLSQMLADGDDPLSKLRAEKAARLAAAARTMTFGECALEYFRSHSTTWRHAKSVAQWSATVLGKTPRGLPAENDYCRTLRLLPVAGVDTPAVLSVLRPIWHTKPETASRLRARVAAAIDWATAAGYRSGDNPADWKIIGKLLPARAKVAPVVHFPAVPYRDLPGLMIRLRQRAGTAARALEFLILTAARTSEALNATWDEIDFDEKTWIVSAEKMKADREHRVPLSPDALRLLKALPREKGNGYLFLSSRAGKSLSHEALLQVMRRMGFPQSVHGFRSSFSDWAHVKGFNNHEIELSLAHAVGSVTERAYRRGDLLERRRPLMVTWAEYLSSPPLVAGEVVPIKRRKARG